MQYIVWLQSQAEILSAGLSFLAVVNQTCLQTTRLFSNMTKGSSFSLKCQYEVFKITVLTKSYIYCPQIFATYRTSCVPRPVYCCQFYNQKLPKSSLLLPGKFFFKYVVKNYIFDSLTVWLKYQEGFLYLAMYTLKLLCPFLQGMLLFLFFLVSYIHE